MKKVILIVLFILLLGFFTKFFIDDNLKAVNTADTSNKIFVIPKGRSIKSIGMDLKTAGLIKNELFFLFYIKLNNLQSSIQAGDFRLSPAYNFSKIISEIQHGTLDVIVTIPEGLRKEEVAQKVAAVLNIPEDNFNQLAEEGYLFPDTYFIPKEANAQDIITIMNKNFYRRLSGIDSNLTNPQSITPSGRTLRDDLILASIIEREAKYDEDRPLVAGILIKRLNKDWPLEVDATLQYILGYSREEKKWWRSEITQEDLGIDSSFNTRKNKGLPPAPICNPGLSAIKSVFYPTQSDYWFYLSDKSGKMHYAKTMEEHSANIKKFL